jgi:hypothetical protein
MATERTVSWSMVLEHFDTDTEDTAILGVIIHRREQNERKEYTKLPFNQMAKLTRLSERTCKRRVKKMAERGILEVYSDRGGRTNGNRYKIHADNAWVRPKKQRALGRQGKSATEVAENAAKHMPPIKAGTEDIA